MSRPDYPLHRVGAVVVVVGALVVAVLLNVSLTADDPVSRYETARAAIQLGDALGFVAAGGLVFGIGVGLALGGLRAYHEEVSDR